MEKVLLAGATGYLGQFVAAELKKQGYKTAVIVRDKTRFDQLEIEVDEVYQGEVTKPVTLSPCFKNVDAVISTIGITRQKDGLTYMDVDYQANKNLLDLAIKNGVKKFIYVSVLNGEALRHTAICDAKERFVDELKNSGIEYSVIRPGGYFSDMTEFYNMAKSGKIYLFGKGNYQSNPIHGADLAEVCVDALQQSTKEIEIGGPEVLTQSEIAEIAFDAINAKAKIKYIPNWVRYLIFKVAQFILSKSRFGPIEFFLTVMSIDMVAPAYGNHTLYNYYKSLNEK